MASKISKKKKKVSYSALNDYFVVGDYGNFDADRRVQLKMPSAIVDELDAEFPSIDRSKLMTLLAVSALIEKKRNDNPELEHWRNDEQYDLDRMWDYLEEREHEE